MVRTSKGMRHSIRLALVTSALMLGMVATEAQSLGPGSPAPKLEVKTWYKGTPVKELAKDKIYVVEFWATWCGPCIQVIPHVTDLAKKNTDVTFIGVSVWEDDVDGNIKKFIDNMGDKMVYNVGYSGNQEGMAKSWLEPAGQNGIPASFIVKDGVIQWIGHPQGLDEPLKQVKDGTFDLEAAKAEHAKQLEATKAQQAIFAKLDAISEGMKTWTADETMAKIAEFEKENPDYAMYTGPMKLQALHKKDPKEFDKKITELLAGNEQDTFAVVNFAFSMLQTDKVLAVKVMDKYSAKKNPTFIDHMNATQFYLSAGEFKKGLAAVEKAEKAYPTSQYKDDASIKTMVAEMKKSLQDGQKKKEEEAKAAAGGGK